MISGLGGVILNEFVQWEGPEDQKMKGKFTSKVATQAALPSLFGFGFLLSLWTLLYIVFY